MSFTLLLVVVATAAAAALFVVACNEWPFSCTTQSIPAPGYTVIN